MANIHTRMPVILNEKDEKVWLEPILKPEKALNLLSPLSSSLMEMYPVSFLVNSPRNNTASLLKRDNS